MRRSAKSTLTVLIAVVVLLLAVCPGYSQLYGNTYQFYPSPGWYNNRVLYFLMTDASDQNIALYFRQRLGFNVNYSPLLANALNPALRNFVSIDPVTRQIIANNAEFMPDLYVVTNPNDTIAGMQFPVFSAQWPINVPAPPPGIGVKTGIDPGVYMPFWRLKLVMWNDPANAILLRAGNEILSRRGMGPSQVRIADAGVVVAASIIINTVPQKIPQATVGYYGGSVIVRLPVKAVYVGGKVYKTVRLDFSDQGAANVNKGTWAPWLAKFNELKQIAPMALAFQRLYTFWPVPPVSQLFVGSQVPMPFGPANGNPAYSPMMNEWIVRTDAVPFPKPIFTNATAPAFLALPKNATNYIVYEPIIGQ